MIDTFFFPYITTGKKAIKDLIEVFKNKKFDKDTYIETLNFLEPWKEGQNVDYKQANITHFCFPVDFELKLRYTKEDQNKQLDIDINWNRTRFLFSKRYNEKNKVGLLMVPMSEEITIIVGDERKDFLPPWCKYNQPDKTIIKVYDHSKNRIINSTPIDGNFLPESPFQTSLIINKDFDEINVFTFGKLKYEYSFKPTIKKSKEPEILYL